MLSASSTLTPLSHTSATDASPSRRSNVSTDAPPAPFDSCEKRVRYHQSHASKSRGLSKSQAPAARSASAAVPGTLAGRNVPAPSSSFGVTMRSGGADATSQPCSRRFVRYVLAERILAMASPPPFSTRVARGENLHAALPGRLHPSERGPEVDGFLGAHRARCLENDGLGAFRDAREVLGRIGEIRAERARSATSRNARQARSSHRTGARWRRRRHGKSRALRLAATASPSRSCPENGGRDSPSAGGSSAVARGAPSAPRGLPGSAAPRARAARTRQKRAAGGGRAAGSRRRRLRSRLPRAGGSSRCGNSRACGVRRRWFR